MVRRRTQPAKTQKPPPSPEPPIEEETYFLNPDAVSPHLYCCICQEVFKEPWRAPCGHSFCKRCIFDWLGKNSICPTDRRPVTTAQLHHDFLVQNIIDDYVVACPWRALGCHNVGPLHQLKEHKKVCPLNPNNMPKVLQEYSVQVLSTAQQELQRKQVQRSLAAISSAGGGGRHSLPAASTSSTSILTTTPAAAPAAGRQSSSGAGTASAFDQLLLEEIERGGGDSSNDAAANESAGVAPAAANQSVGTAVAAANESAGVAAAAANESARAAAAAANESAGAAAAAANQSTAAPSSSSGANEAAATGAADSSLDDDEANLPGGQLPSLRMRLYMNSQNENRSEFVSFLENLSSQPQLLRVPQSISRFCEPPDSKRPRLGDGND